MTVINEAIVGRPFTLELDVQTYDHDTAQDVTIDLSSASAVSVRLITPKGDSADYATSIPSNPNYRVVYNGTGAELTQAGVWSVVVVYTLSGVERESINTVTFTVHLASPVP